MSKTIRIGVMGCASIAERMMIPAIQQSADCSLVAVASRSLEKAQFWGANYNCDYEQGYEALLDRDDIDAIYMPLPTGLHKGWAIKALEAGKHVLLEKSLAANYDDAAAIVSTASERGLLVQENFMFAYHRQFALIQELIRAGDLGTIRSMRSSFGFPPFADYDNIRYQKELAGGALLDAGAYTLKIALLLLGHNLQLQGGCLLVDQEKDVDIAGGVLLNDVHGVVVSSAFGFDHFYQCSLEIWGSKGRLTTERIFTAGPGVKPVIKLELAGGMKVIEVEPDNHFVNLLNDFSQTIQTGAFKQHYDEILVQARMLQTVLDRVQRIYN